jgi:putative ABC transport system substrate-binding protein
VADISPPPYRAKQGRSLHWTIPLAANAVHACCLKLLFPVFALRATSLRCSRPCLGLALAGCIAQAASLTVLMGDDIAASSEFVQQLRAARNPAAASSWFACRPAGPIRSSRWTAPPVPSARANAGVRTRGLRTADAPVTMAVGPAAARAAVERPGQEPLVLAMLSRLDYEALKAGSPALRRGDRRVGVLLRDPAMADQLALISAVLPQKHRIGVVATPNPNRWCASCSAPQGANPAWDVRVEYAPDARSLAGRAAHRWCRKATR